MRVALIGATGLIGRNLWPLLEERHDLLVVGRRPSGARREKIGPLERWPELLAGERIDTAICAVGTTRKKAGNWEAFARVDQFAQTNFARGAKAAGARQFITVSSSGADARSSNRYLRLKGEIEEELADVGFGRLDVARPGLLLGERPGDSRPLERVGILLSPVVRPLLRGSLDRYAGIGADVVARAIAALVGRRGEGRFVHQNRGLRQLAEA